MGDWKVISLFAGAGGIDYGFEAAGYETCFTNDFNADCCSTLLTNRSWPVIERPIEDVPAKQILSESGLKVGDAHVLIGGPPCQPFSKSGYWANGNTGRLKDPRAQTLIEYMRCVDELLPEVFLLENVHGISYSGKEEGLLLLAKMMAQINERRGTSYQGSWSVLNTADYGVPQARKRFFLVAHRDGKIFTFPNRTHASLPLDTGQRGHLRQHVRPYVTAWDAIGHISPSPDEDLAVKGRWTGLLPSIPEGENYLWHTNRKGGLPLFGWRRRYWSFLLKLAKDRPSWTIQAQPGPAIGPFHWKNRRLSVQEMAAIQTFPESLTFAGGRVSIQRQLGNAVPSLMAEVLARAIAQQLFGATYEDEPKLSVPLNRPIPTPEPLGTVPKDFLDLVGEHPDHPGEGRGAAARRRSGDEALTLFD